MNLGLYTVPSVSNTVVDQRLFFFPQLIKMEAEEKKVMEIKISHLQEFIIRYTQIYF